MMVYQTSVLATIVALVFILSATFVGLGITGNLNNESTPMLVTILGIVASTVAALVSVVRTDRAVAEAKKTNGEVADLLHRMEISDPGGRTEPHG